MPQYTSFLFSLLLTVFLFFFQASSYPSHGVSHSLLQMSLTSGNIQLYRPARRSLADAPGSEPVETAYAALAVDRTSRKDPLNGFEKYRGGWNLSNRHYWASAGYTAFPFFIIAIIWFAVFCLLLSIICVGHFCSKRSYGYSGAAYVCSMIVLVASGFAAMIGCIIMYTSQDKFHGSMIGTMEYIVTQADTTVGKLQRISNSLSASKIVQIDQVSLPSGIQSDIDLIGSKITYSATNLADTALRNSHRIEDVLDNMRVLLIIVAVVMLSLTFLGFLFSIFGMQVLVYIMVVIGWILVTGTFILCGVFLLLHTVSGDTCAAMNEWVETPSPHTPLEDILPCIESATAQEALLRGKEVSYRLVELMNEVITNISNINFSPDIKSVYYNQSGPHLPTLCNRFHSDFTDRACSVGEVDLNNAEQVLQNYTCQVSITQPEICKTQGRLTPTLFNQMVASINAGNELYNWAPFLVELQDCNYAKMTFRSIYRNKCPHLKVYSGYIYVGLATISVALMLSVVLWGVYTRERCYRIRTKQGLDSIETRAKHS